MTSRDRALTALAHEEPGRVPLFLGTSGVTTLLGSGYERLKALKEPLPQIELLPTKGVNFETVSAFIKAGAIAVGTGNALVTQAQMAARDYAGITDNARRFTQIVREARKDKA